MSRVATVHVVSLCRMVAAVVIRKLFMPIRVQEIHKEGSSVVLPEVRQRVLLKVFQVPDGVAIAAAVSLGSNFQSIPNTGML